MVNIVILVTGKYDDSCESSDSGEYEDSSDPGDSRNFSNSGKSSLTSIIIFWRIW